MKRICLIEFNGYHEECLFSQLMFLKESGYWVSLVIHRKMEERITPYEHLVNDLKVVNTGSKVFLFTRILRIFQIRNYIKKLDINTVLFNTASSNKETLLLPFLLGDLKLLGIIHDLKKLKNSFSQRLISRNIKKYFVLNDALLKNSDIKTSNLRFQSFYPIFFQKKGLPKIEKSPGDIWVTIPGKVETKRRNYAMIISILRELSPEQRPTLIILGNLTDTEEEHQKIRRSIKEAQLESCIKTFEGFIPNDLFHSFIAHSDFLLLPKSSFGEYYADTKIMGAYNLAFSYKKPLIFPDSLKVVNDLSQNGISYLNKDDLSNILDKKFLETANIKTNYDGPKWNFETQRLRYIDFIEA